MTKKNRRQNKNPYNESIYYNDNKYKLVMKNLEQTILFNMTPTNLNDVISNNNKSDNTLHKTLQKMNKLYKVKSSASKNKTKKANNKK